MTDETNVVHLDHHSPEVSNSGDALVALPVTARSRVKDALQQSGLSQAAAAKEIGISPSALNQWLQGRYAGNNEEVEEKVGRWLDARDRRDDAADAIVAIPRWFRSPSSQKILDTLAYGQMAGDIVCIYGGPGVGKTVSLRQYRETNPATWIATMAPDSAPVVPALEEVAEAVGLREASGGARKIARAIRRKVDGTRGLLIIDEAQHLSVAALEELRSIHDATGIGLALVGNESVYARLTGGTRASHFAQLFSRIGSRLFISRPTIGDVRALATAWGVKGKAELDLLQQMASKPGALRGVSKVLALASMSAGGSEITVSALRHAWANLGAQE